MKRILYVVEGKTDCDKLKKSGCKYVIKTNGFGSVSRETIFINKVLSNREVVLFFDPDGSGRKILDYIVSHIDKENKSNLHHVEIKKNLAVKNGKVGVAEASVDTVKECLKEYLKLEENVLEEELKFNDLILLNLTGPNSSDKRKKLEERFNFHSTSSRDLLLRLNCLGLDKDEIEDIIYD